MSNHVCKGEDSPSNYVGKVVASKGGESCVKTSRKGGKKQAGTRTESRRPPSVKTRNNEEKMGEEKAHQQTT